MMDDLGLSADIVGASSIFTGDEEVFAFARALVRFHFFPLNVRKLTKSVCSIQSRLSEMSSVQWNSSPHSERKADGLDSTTAGEAVQVKQSGEKVRSVEDVQERVRQVSRA